MNLFFQPRIHQVICGDINVNIIQNGIKQKFLRNLMNRNNIDIPKILAPRRENASSKSCLNVFFSNFPLKITLDQSDVSDHHPVLATLNTNFRVSCKESNSFSGNWKALENENELIEAQYFLGVKLKNLSSPKKTIDKEISELHSSLMITLEKFCLMKKVKRSKRKNWIE